ncbi:MAG TPA: sulfatase-like hydrolase/transferase, partial [Thermoanaerobaculia bacterium]|nr:sulfatase-like hydrolase/transferase [Thermoanaerobaculia bacterium]
ARGERGQRAPDPAREHLASRWLQRAGLTPEGLGVLQRRYAQEVAFADGEVGRLLALLDRGSLAGRTAVAVTADHGESFLEHGHLRHCRSLHEEEVRVPLMLRLPAGAAGRGGRRIAAPVTLLDVAPTLLELAGAAPRSLRGVEGSSLLGRLDPAHRPATRPAAPPVVAVAGTWSAVVAGRHKLLRDAAGGETRLYDLAADPAELHDLAAERPQLTERLERRLQPTSPAAAAHLQRLQALGYLR